MSKKIGTNFVSYAVLVDIVCYTTNMGEESPVRKIKRLTAANRPITVRDVPTDILEGILRSIGWPWGHAKRLQSGWSGNTRLDRRTLEDFAGGADQEGHK